MPKNTVMNGEEFTFVCEQRMLYVEALLDNLIGPPNHSKRKRLIGKLDQWRDVAYDRFNQALPRDFVHAVTAPELLDLPQAPTRSWELSKI